MNIGRGFRIIREQKGISQAKMAKLAKMGQSTISAIELGKKMPAKLSVKKMCKGLKVPFIAVVVLSLEDKDISKDKKHIYKKIHPVLVSLVEEIIK